jgi:hypothetical protein
MTSMTRVRLVVLPLIAAAVLASGAATALGAGIQLTPVGDEPNASGTATLSSVHYRGPWRAPYWSGTSHVTCRGLRPGATYTINGYRSFTADAKGNGAGRITVGGDGNGEGWWNPAMVTVQRDDGTTVLAGAVSPMW